MTFVPPGARGVTPQHRGRYRGFDVLDQVDVWDELTAGVVLARLRPARDFAFFTREERTVVEPLVDLLLAQDEEPRVPVAAMIDARLAAGETDGWHYDDLPEDGQAWRNSLHFLDEDAYPLYGSGFATASRSHQASLLQNVRALATDSDRWHDYPAEQVWSLWTRYACTAFYSHPWAWNEIGFPGPAYPRGYLNLGVDAREHWEVPETDAEDPVPFAARVEQERSAHRALLAGET